MWHEQELDDAVTAFEQVKKLPHGTELHGIAQAIAAGSGASGLNDLEAWQEGLTWLATLPDPELRPGTLESLRTLRTVAQECAAAHYSRAPLNRSAALGRAGGALNRLIETGAEPCPEPERPLILRIAEKWRGIVLEAGGAAGEEVLRQPILNPYEGYSGLPVTGTTFVGRRGAMGQIETCWSTGDLLPAIILYGHRRMGKTSILRNLEHAAGPGTLLVYLDMQDAGWIDHTGQLLLDLAEAVHRNATAAELDAGPPPTEEKFTDLGRARRALNALLGLLEPQMDEGRRLILAVDEFELIEDGIRAGPIDAGFLPYLRALNQRHRWLALIFGGLHTLDEMGRDYRSAFYGQAEHVRVGYLDRDDAFRLITQPHPDFALEYAPELCERLYELTYGQPYLLQRLCWELVNRWNERFLAEGESVPRTLVLTDLEPVLTADLYAAADYYFDGVWSNVTDAERALMTRMAGREEPWSRRELPIPASVDPPTLDDTLELLRRHDVIVEDAGGVRFASELMR
ncbi:MAG: ATP-binding protein, partial [bacterium]|nr:ATP-binding protein [bacterium]